MKKTRLILGLTLGLDLASTVTAIAQSAPPLQLDQKTLDATVACYRIEKTAIISTVMGAIDKDTSRASLVLSNLLRICQKEQVEATRIAITETYPCLPPYTTCSVDIRPDAKSFRLIGFIYGQRIKTNVIDTVQAPEGSWVTNYQPGTRYDPRLNLKATPVKVFFTRTKPAPIKPIDK